MPLTVSDDLEYTLNIYFMLLYILLIRPSVTLRK